jgi:Ca2+-binding RTX toxin-like protein
MRWRRAGRGASVAVAIAAIALLPPGAGAGLDEPEPTSCDVASRTVKFASVFTLRDTISAYQDQTGAIVVTARGASEDTGYTRQDVCPAIPGGWRLVVLSGDSGGDTIGVLTLPAAIKAKLNGGGTVDDLEGHKGVDELRGGPSHDTLKSFEGNDLLVGGSSQDKLLAGRGKDRIKVNDGGNQPDVVKCGDGVDVVFADKVDRLKGCEKVR